MTTTRPSTEQVIDAVATAVQPEHEVMVDDEWQLLYATRRNRALCLVVQHRDGTTREHTFCQTSQGPWDG